MISYFSKLWGTLFRMGQWPFHRRVCLKTIASVRGPAAEMYSLCLFERIHGIGSLVEICCSFFCEQVGFKRFALFLVENCQEQTVIYRVSCTSRSSIFENRLKTSVFFAFIKAKRFWCHHRQRRRRNTGEYQHPFKN